MATEAHPPLTITLNSHTIIRFMWMLQPKTNGWLQDDRGLREQHSLVCIELNKPFILLIPYESVRVHFFHQKLRFVLGKNIADMGTIHIEIGIFGQEGVLAELTVDCLHTAEPVSVSKSDSGSSKHDGGKRDDRRDSKSGHGDGKREMSSSGKRKLADASDIYLAQDSDDATKGSNSSIINNNIKQESRDELEYQQRKLQDLLTPLTPEEIKLLNTLVWYDANLHISKKLKPTDSLVITFTVVKSIPVRVVNTVKLASIHLS
jgi:hypothetical protein